MADLIAEHDTMPGSSISQMIKHIGSWGQPSGRGLYMFRSMVVATSTAALFGVGCAVLGGLLMGSGSLAFIAGSSLGFVGASVHYYQLSLRQALLALQRYPRLLQLHLEHNFPCEGYDRLEGPQLAPEYWRRGLARQGNLIAAWHSASGTLEDIHDARVQLMAENIAKGGGGASKRGA